MAAVKLVLPEIEQGATYLHLLKYREADGVTPIDLSGCTARMQIRATIASPSVIYDLTTENGCLIVDGLAGEVSIVLSSQITDSLQPIKGAVYDLELYFPNGHTVRLISGKVSVSGGVTRG